MWNLPARGDYYIDIRISRNTLIAVVVSVLIHMVLLFAFFPRKPLLEPLSPPDNIVVELAKKPAPKSTPAPSPPPEPQPKKPAVKTPRVMAVEKPAPQIRQQTTPPAPARETAQPAPTDMMSYINAQRAKRQSQEEYATQQNAAASASEQQTEDERRDAIIKRNLAARQGNGGVFTVSSKTSRSAIISFNGWHGEFSTSRRETYEVVPGPDGDINLAIVRKVIARIRQENSGDFPWESQRMGRTVTLSARPEDNAGLEEFLMKEFFGGRGGRSFNDY